MHLLTGKGWEGRGARDRTERGGRKTRLKEEATERESCLSANLFGKINFRSLLRRGEALVGVSIALSNKQVECKVIFD